jgi:hypothetical protein
VAEELPIAGGPETAKIRNLWAVALLPFITFGIYFLVWYYKINREMADLGRKRNEPELGDSPITSLIAITIGAIIIVPAIISFVNTYKRIKLSQQTVGVSEVQQINGWFVLIGYLVISPVAYAVQQDGLNKVWRIDSGQEAPAIPAAAAAPAAPAPAAPEAPATPEPPAPPSA